MPNGTSATRKSHLVPVLLLTAAGAFGGSCGRSMDLAESRRPGRDDGPSISTGLNALEQGGATPAPVSAEDPSPDQRTQELLALMDQAQRHGAVSVDGSAMTPGEALADAGAGPGAEANPGALYALPEEPELAVRIPEGALTTGFDESFLPPAPQGTNEDHRQRLLGELASLLHEEASAAAAPAPSLAQIAALRFLQLPPTRTIVTSDNPGGGLGGAAAPLPDTPAARFGPDPLDDYLRSVTLSPVERDMLDAWAKFVYEARSALVQYQDIGAISSPAQTLADALRAWRPLEINDVRLCSKVEGYGVFSELKKFGDQHKFLANRPARMIVYLEPVNFQHTSVSRDGVWGHEVRFVQDLRLYHAAKDTDTLVWRKPDQEIIDFSRNRRRDFFVVQVIELPATLGVGSYRLKVSLTDKANGGMAESIVPLEIVADVSALRE